MITTTHNGCKIKVSARKGLLWGIVIATVNGESFPVTEGFDEAKAVDEIRRDLDLVHAAPVDGNRWPAHYYPPGTYYLCRYEHPVTPGGICKHTYCLRKEGRS